MRVDGYEVEPYAAGMVSVRATALCIQKMTVDDD